MIGDYRSRVDKMLAQKSLLLSQFDQAKLTLDSRKLRLHYAEEALVVAQAAANMTQKHLEFHISNLVSTALAAVFPDPYIFGVEFVTRRGTSECDMYFEKGGKRMSPMESSGYGAVDIASLALRVAFWSMHTKASPVLILDEPTRNLSLSLHDRASEMIKTLSDKLGIQFIIVSHSESLTTYADKTFKVTRKKGRSTIDAGN